MRKNNNVRNYFTRNIQENGEDFILRKNVQEIEYDFNSIFRDISRGKVDMYKYVNYFTEQQFIVTLQKIALDKHIENSIIYTSVTQEINRLVCMYGGNIDSIYYNIQEKSKRLSEAYAIINEALCASMNGNHSYLYLLQNKLNIYKQIL